MQKIDFITDGNFEAKSLDDLLYRIKLYCRKKDNFLYNLENLSTIDGEQSEIFLSENEVMNAQIKLDSMLNQSKNESIIEEEYCESYSNIMDLNGSYFGITKLIS